MRGRPPTLSPPISVRASNDIRCKLPLLKTPSRPQMVAIPSLQRSRSARQKSVSSTTRAERPDRDTIMIRKTSAPRPCSPSSQTSRPVLSLFLALAPRIISIDQRGREGQAPVYVSRHRKSSNLYISPRPIIRRVLVSLEPHVLSSCPLSSLPFSCLECS